MPLSPENSAAGDEIIRQSLRTSRKFKRFRPPSCHNIKKGKEKTNVAPTSDEPGPIAPAAAYQLPLPALGMPFAWDGRVDVEPSEAAASPAAAPTLALAAPPSPVVAPSACPLARASASGSVPAHLPGCSGRGAAEAGPADGRSKLPVTNAMMKAYVAMRGGLHGVAADAPEPLLGRMLDQELARGVDAPQ